jgi:tetratricopeptide (TPR) repeat protein
MGFLRESKRETRRDKRKSKKHKKKSRQKMWRAGSDSNGGIINWIAYTAVLLGIGGCGVYYFVNVQLKTLYEIEYYRGESDWEKVLELADKQPGQLLSMQARNQALCHLGRFGDEMFNYQQHPDGLMLSHVVFDKSYWHKYGLYIDLGLIGQADEVLTESMVMFRDNPFILKELAMVNMISGKNKTARVYLGALQKRLFFGKWAREYLAKLENDPELRGDDEIQKLRALIPNGKAGRFLATPEMQLKAQIENGRKNKMAFEYLLALYMLRGEMWNVVEVAGGMEMYDYEKIPIAFEEAILLNNKHNKNKITLKKLKIREETKRRFDEFMSVTIRYRTKDAARSELTRKFKNTYMYYYFYGIPER